MTIVAYLASVSPVMELVLMPRLDRVMAGEKFESHWIDDSWESYSTPWAKVAGTQIGEKILMPYHRAWISLEN